MSAISLPKLGDGITVRKFDVVPQQVLNVSSWFETESIEVTVGESVGLSRVGLPESALAWFIADGWSVVEKLDSGGRDVWSQGLKVHSYSSWTKYRLVRRKMQSERVLQDMVTEFTKAYNEGKVINNQRYNELVSLYTLMVNSTEDALGESFSAQQPDFEALVDYIVAELKGGINEFKAKIEGIMDGYGEARREAIRRLFDAKLAQARQGLVSRGLFNNTVWPSVSAGIDRERSFALNDLEDKITDKVINTQELILKVRAQVLKDILDVYKSLWAIKADDFTRVVNARNSVFKWMLDFMERREDQYPDMGNLVNISASLGYGQAGSVSPGGKV